MIQNPAQKHSITEVGGVRALSTNSHPFLSPSDPHVQAGRDCCPGCGAPLAPPFYSVAATPVTVATVFATKAQAQAVPLGRVDLVLCEQCGLLFNPWFQSALAEVGARYESSQASSAHFSTFAQSLARAWIERHALRGKSVLEIGCGRGEFLRLMLSEGVEDALGLDPVAPVEGIHEPRLTIEPRSFDADTITCDADAVVCRHTLEHVPDVRAFLGLLAQWAQRVSGRVVLFEVPAAERILSEAAFWDVYYEHCNYFTAASLQWAFESAGFEVLRIEKVYADQYLIIEARAARRGAAARPDFSSLSGDCRRFGNIARQAIAHCDRHLETLAACCRPTVLWQGAAKTVGFLSSLHCSGLIHSAVDLSPQRHGQYLPGSGLPVYAPRTLRAIDPAHVVLMNPVYLDEVRAQLTALGVGAALLTVNDLCGPDISALQSTTR
jgi:SAM-dependent methyltransferase